MLMFVLIIILVMMAVMVVMVTIMVMTVAENVNLPHTVLPGDFPARVVDLFDPLVNMMTVVAMVVMFVVVVVIAVICHEVSGWCRRLGGELNPGLLKVGLAAGPAAHPRLMSVAGEAPVINDRTIRSGAKKLGPRLLRVAFVAGNDDQSFAPLLGLRICA
uniref:Uncharacterized protein n=1 Tax=Pyramimonas obovata TaxID=1411642 RepID=A0A7S0WQ29_9CHLO